MDRTLSRRLRAAIVGLDDVMAGASTFDEHREAFFVDGREMAAIHDGFVKIRLSWPLIKQRREELRSDARVRIPRSGTDWIEVSLEHRDDIGMIVALVEAAAAAYRPPPGHARKPPPAGADLERRPRWH